MAPPPNREMSAKVIGDYLLKGYTMLNGFCPECNSPMMRRRHESELCVVCRDILKLEEQKVESATEPPAPKSSTSSSSLIDLEFDLINQATSLDNQVNSDRHPIPLGWTPGTNTTNANKNNESSRNTSNKRLAINGGSASMDSSEEVEQQNNTVCRQPLPPELHSHALIAVREVIAACSAKLRWASGKLVQNTDNNFAEMADLNAFMQNTLATLDQAYKFAEKNL